MALTSSLKISGNIIYIPPIVVHLLTEVNLVCPLNVTLPTEAGSDTTRVNWTEPVLTGWDETNFTSSAQSGDVFPIGSQRVTYHQRFASSLILTCSFEIVIVGEEQNNFMINNRVYGVIFSQPIKSETLYKTCFKLSTQTTFVTGCSGNIDYFLNIEINLLKKHLCSIISSNMLFFVDT